MTKIPLLGLYSSSKLLYRPGECDLSQQEIDLGTFYLGFNKGGCTCNRIRIWLINTPESVPQNISVDFGWSSKGIVPWLFPFKGKSREIYTFKSKTILITILSLILHFCSMYITNGNSQWGMGTQFHVIYKEVDQWGDRSWDINQTDS